MSEEMNHINIDYLKKSLNTMNSVNDCMQTESLSNYFIEIDKMIQSINFEHANCISDYKDDLNAIYSKIDAMKNSIFELKNALAATIQNFSSIEEVQLRENDFSIKNIETNITQIPPVTDEQAPQQEVTPQETTTPINTVPIGLGIGAAGISGAIGAVIVDSMNDNKKEKIDDYNPEIEQYEPSDASEEPEMIEPVFDDKAPYHASRNSSSIDKYYGTNITEYYENEDEE